MFKEISEMEFATVTRQGIMMHFMRTAREIALGFEWSIIIIIDQMQVKLLIWNHSENANHYELVQVHE
jgi:hypothetical protein